MSHEALGHQAIDKEVKSSSTAFVAKQCALDRNVVRFHLFKCHNPVSPSTSFSHSARRAV